MPLYPPDQESVLLKSKGLDPSKYTIGDDGGVYERDIVSPTPSLTIPAPQVTAPSLSTSTSGAFAAHAASNLLPAGAGLLTGGLAATGAAALAPETFGLSLILPLLAGLGGGIGGSVAAKKLQDVVTPDVASKYLATSEQEHPYASAGGDIAANLAFLRPDLGAIKSIPKVASQLLTGVAPDLGDIGNAANVALSTGLSVAPSVSQYAQTGQVDPRMLALQLAAGATITNPREYLSKTLGLPIHPNANVETPTLPTENLATDETIKVQQPTVSLTADQTISAGGAPLNKGYAPTGKLTPSGIERLMNTEQGREVTRRPDVTAPSELTRMEGEGGITPEPTESPITPLGAVSKLPIAFDEKPTGTSIGVRKVKPEPFKQQNATQPTDAELAQEKLESSNRAQRFQAEEPTVIQKINDDLKQKGVFTGVTRSWYDAWKQLGLKFRNVKLETDNTIHDPSTGKPIAGEAVVKDGVEEGLAKINPDKAGLDTPAHEIFHHFWNFLKQTNSKLTSSLTDQVNRIPDYQRWKVSRDTSNLASDPEEYLAQNVGSDTVRRQLLSKGASADWLGDFKAAIKTKLLKSGNTEDLARFMSNKLINDRPVFQDYNKLLKSAVAKGSGPEQGATIDKSSESSTLEGKGATPEDIAKYNELGVSFNKHMAEGTFDTPEFRKVWQDREDIKNKYGGHIPKQSEDSPFNIKKEDLVSAKDNVPNKVHSSYLESKNKQQLRSAARLPSGRIVEGKAGDHHFNLKLPDDAELGFVTPNGNFITREQAAEYIRAGFKHSEESTVEKQFDYKNLTDEEKRSYGQLHEDAFAARQEHEKNPTSEEAQNKLIDSENNLTRFEKNRTTTEKSKYNIPDWAKLYDILPAEEFAGYDKKYINPEDKYVLGTKEGELYESQDKGFAIGKTPEDVLDIVNSDKKYFGADRNKQSEESTINKTDKQEDYHYSSPFGLKFLTPRYEKLQQAFPNKTGKLATEALKKHADWVDRYQGKIGNSLIQVLKESGLHQDQLPNVVRYLYDKDQGIKEPNIVLNKQQKDFVDKYIEQMKYPKQVQRDLGLLVKSGAGNLRIAGIKEDGYFPNMLDPNVAYTWTEKPNSTEAKQYDKIYTDYLKQKGSSEADANETLANYKKALNNDVTPDNEFGAINKAEGNGLPYDLIDKNLARVFSRYGRRAASHMGYFKYLQNDPNMQKAFSIKDQYGNIANPSDIDYIGSSKEGQAALRSVLGLDKSSVNPILASVNRLVGNVIMGPGTALRNLIQGPAFIAPYLRTTQIPVLLSAIGKMNEAAARAFKNNAIRTTFADFDAAGNYTRHPDKTIDNISRIAEVLRKYQGRDLADKVEGLYTYTVGEILTKQNLAAAMNGDKKSINFIKKFSTTVDGGADKMLGKDYKLNEDDLGAVAKSFTDAVRGSYDASGLPSFALEGSVSPFLSLERWSIEKANRVWKDVMLPIKQSGDFAPLLKLGLSTLVSGAMIEKINEELSHKKDSDPTIGEVEKYGTNEDVARKLIGLWQLGSAGGIVTDFLKVGVDAAQGKGFSSGNPINFPLYNFVTENLGHNIGDYIQSVKNGDNPIDSTGRLIEAITKQSSQTYRYANNNFIEPEKAERSDKLRDVRAFDELVNKRVTPSSNDQANDISGHDMEEFKKATNIQDAIKYLPALMKRAFEKSHGDPELLASELEKIKSNSYQTVPSPENTPIQFAKYLQFLKDTQGEKSAVDRYADYIKQTTVNQVKSSLVPTL